MIGLVNVIKVMIYIPLQLGSRTNRRGNQQDSNTKNPHFVTFNYKSKKYVKNKQFTAQRVYTALSTCLPTTKFDRYNISIWVQYQNKVTVELRFSVANDISTFRSVPLTRLNFRWCRLTDWVTMRYELLLWSWDSLEQIWGLRITKYWCCGVARCNKNPRLSLQCQYVRP